MKTRVTILLILFSLSITNTTYAQWWRDLLRAGAEVVGATVLTNTVEKYGGEQYGNQEAAEKFTRDVYEFVGADTRNAEAGIAWKNAENDYQKANIAKNYAFDAVSQLSNNPERVELLRNMVETELTYFDDETKIKTNEDKAVAIDKRTLSWANIIFDAKQLHENAQAEKRAKEKLEMEEQMRSIRGDYYNSEEVSDVTNYIIATVQSDLLSESEKEECLSQFHLKQSPKEIINIITPILNEDRDAELRRQEEQKRQKEEEERRLAEERRIAEQRAAEEKRNALQSLESIKIDGYAFDETELSDAQKNDLNEAASILNKYPEVRVLLTGHTCKIGYKNINLRKGMKRAEAAKEYLMLKGVAESRISTDSKGETEPLVPNTSKENFKQNRRVEIQIIK
jgi:outer membrane protein OmpA-like peptidoglycan-associated protein